MEQNINDRNLTVKVTNNGRRTAQFVQAYALFFDADNNLISVDSEYVVDNDSEKILTCTVLVDVLVSMAPDNVSRGADYVEYKI